MKRLLTAILSCYMPFAAANCDGGHVQLTFKNDKTQTLTLQISSQGKTYVGAAAIAPKQEQQFCLPLQEGGLYQVSLKAAYYPSPVYTHTVDMGLGLVSVSASSIFP